MGGIEVLKDGKRHGEAASLGLLGLVVVLVEHDALELRLGESEFSHGDDESVMR